MLIFPPVNNKRNHDFENIADNNSNGNKHDSCLKDNTIFDPINNTDKDYPDSRVECRTLTSYYYYNNNRYYDSVNNVDNNSNDNNHDYFLWDYYNSSVLTGSKPYTATKRKANNDNNQGSHSCSHDIDVNYNNKKFENNNNNNYYSNNNNPSANFEDNNDNNKDGNVVSAFTPIPADSNADNAPPGRINKNTVMRLPPFISHPNGIVLRVFKQK